MKDGITLTDWLWLNIGRGTLDPRSAEWIMLWAGWVDRLRLTGNGVVPDQAELAWRVLWDRLHA